MKFARNSYEIRTNFVRIFVNFVQFAPFVVALPRVHSPFLNLCLAHFPTFAGPVHRVVAGYSAPRQAQVQAPALIARGARRSPQGPRWRPARRHRWWTAAKRGRQCAQRGVAALWTFGRQRGQHRHGACGARGGGAHAVPRRVGRPPTTTPPWTGSPWPPGSRIRPGPSRCRPGPMGGSGISVPCGTWSWSPGGCRAPSASPSPAPLWSRGGGGQPACGAGAGGHVCLPACEWALAGADRVVADWGGGDGDDGWGFWAECAHGLGAAEAGVGGRGMACHARPCGEAAEDGGG